MKKKQKQSESAFEKLLADTIAADADALEREAFEARMRSPMTRGKVKLVYARLRASGKIKAKSKTLRRLPRAGQQTTRSLRRRAQAHDTDEVGK